MALLGLLQGRAARSYTFGDRQEKETRENSGGKTKQMTRVCIICGKPFTPMRKNSVTCGDPECRKQRHRQVADQWKVENYDLVLASRRKRRELLLEQEAHRAKPDTIVAIGYAERQMEKTLSMVPKIDTDL